MGVEIDELITKLSYDIVDADVLEKADKAVSGLSEQNEEAAKTTDELSAKQLDLAEKLQATKEQTDSLKTKQKQLRVEMQKAGGGSKEQREQLEKLDDEIDKSVTKTKKLGDASKRLGLAKAKVGQATRKLSKDQKKLNSAFKKGTKTAGAQGAALEKLATSVKNIAFGVLARDIVRDVIDIAASGVAAILGLVPAFAEVADKLGKTSSALGISSDDLQRLRFAGERSGVSIGQMDKSIGKLTKQLEDARVKGTGPTVDAFETLGLSVKKFQSLGTEERVKQIADALNKLPDPLQRSAIAMQLFGAGNKEMANLLAEGSEGIEALGDRAQELGGVISANAVEGAARLEDQFLDLSTAGGGLVNTLAAGVAPIFEQLTGGVLDWVEANRELLDQGVEALMGTLAGLFEAVGEAMSGVPFDSVVESFVSLVEIVGIFAEQLIGGAGGGLVNMTLDLIGIILKLASAVVKFVQRISDLKDKLDGIPGPLDLIVAGLKFALVVIGLFADAIVGVLNIIGPFLDKLGEMIDGFSLIGDKLPSLSELFTSFELAIRGVVGGVSSLNSELSLSAKLADEAFAAVDRLRNQQKAENQSDAELQRRIREGSEAERTEARAEISRRVATREQEEGGAAQKTGREGRRGATLKKIEGDLKGQSRDVLSALVRDLSVPEKLRTKAQKELDRRRKKGGKGASAENKNLLTAQIAKQIQERANEAGERAAARALIQARQAGGAVDQAAINRIQRDERDRVKAQLTTNFAESGRLPAGIRSDISQIARTPGLAAAGGRVAPPVISIQNIRVTGNTIEINTTVTSTSATAPEISSTIMADLRNVITQRGLNDAILNASTQEQR